MIFKFIIRHLTGTINRLGGERGQFTGENSACTIIINKILDEKTLLNFFCNWDLLHARLNGHCKAWSYKKKGRLRHTGNLLRKNLQLKDVC